MDTGFDPVLKSDRDNLSPLRRAVLERADIPPSSVSNEAAFILRALQSRLHDAPNARPDGTPQTGLDWEHVFDISNRHRIVPLLYAWTREMSPNLPPEGVVSRLQSRYRENSIHNKYQTVELLEIFDSFSANNIQAISYKGPTLAQAAYGDLSLRSFADLDILVQEQDLRQAVSILIDRGYAWRGDQAVPPKASITGGPLVPPLTHEWKFDRQRDQTMVELGWQLHSASTPTSLGFETLWNRAERIELGGGEVTGLAPRDRLLVLAHHGATHRWGELKWIHDFAAVIARNELADWNQVVRRAKRYGIKRRLYTALGLSAALFDIPRDGVATRRPLQDETAVKLAGRIVAQYMTNPLYEPSKLREFFFRLRSTDTLEAAATATTEPFTPKLNDYQWLPVPPTLFPAYYFVRPVRLAERNVRSLSSRISERIEWVRRPAL